MAFITINWLSGTMMRQMTCSVILPEQARGIIGVDSAAVPEKLPALWLLHGLSDNHTTWSRNTSIERYAKERGIAVIMPDGEDSNYADMAHGHPFYRTIANELFDVMGGFFNLSDRREDNWIAGNSMGGGGAMKLGLANPDKFSAIGCLSAGDTVFPRLGSKPGDDPRFDEVVYRAYDSRDLEGTEEDVLGSAKKILVEGLPAPRIFHAIGKDDFLLDAAHKTRDFFMSLEGNPFDYTYIEDEGNHCWAYWDKHIVDFLDFVRK